MDDQDFTKYLKCGYCVIDYDKTGRELIMFGYKIRNIYTDVNANANAHANIDKILVCGDGVFSNFQDDIPEKMKSQIKTFYKVECFKISDIFVQMNRDSFELKKDLVILLKTEKDIIFQLSNDPKTQIYSSEFYKFLEYFKSLFDSINNCPCCSKNLNNNFSIEEVSKNHFESHY